MDLKEMITNYTTYIVDDRENNWEVIELSDLQELLDTDRAEQLILNGVVSTLVCERCESTKETEIICIDCLEDIR